MSAAAGLEGADDKRPLAPRRLRFSRRMVALSLVIVAAGLGLVLCPLSYGPVAGAACGGLGLGVLFSAGYYWTCDNEACS